jgi:hypothetical protein
MGRMKMGAEERKQLAGKNMENIMIAKYGKEWRKRMDNDNIEKEWR